MNTSFNKLSVTNSKKNGPKTVDDDLETESKN